MKTPLDSKQRRPPGRPRSEAARRAILAAAYDLFEKAGPGAVTMEAVAARAGVGKPTIYRYWPNATALQMAALMERPAAPSAAVDNHSGLQALQRQLRSVVDRFATRQGRHMAQILAAAEQDSELAKAFRNRVILASREEGRTFLAQAAREGTVRGNIAVEVALDMIYGPLFYRLLVGHAPLDRHFVDDLLAVMVSGIGRGARYNPARYCASASISSSL